MTGFFPVSITIIFGCLAYYNVRTMAYRTIPLVRRELDKQLTTMVLTQDVVNFFTILPFSIINGLLSNTDLTNDPIIAIKMRFATSISVLFYYIYFGVSFKEIIFIKNIFFRVRFLFMSVHRNDFVDN